jgi:hypothetical protein
MLLSTQMQEILMTGATRRASKAKRVLRRKNLNVDQVKLDRVRDVLGARTETEAIDQALSWILLHEELMEGIRSIQGTAGVENVFDLDGES